jgi:hypothetical protein
MTTSQQNSAGEFIAQVVLFPPEVNLFGAQRNSVLFESDIVAPIDEAWDANRN